MKNLLMAAAIGASLAAGATLGCSAVSKSDATEPTSLVEHGRYTVQIAGWIGRAHV